MFRYVHLVALAFFASHIPVGFVLLYGETSTSVVEVYKKQEKDLSKRRFEQEKWSGGQQSDLTRETFSFEHWNKHYSSLGSKKWDSSVEETSEKKRFKTGLADFFKKNKKIELSQWHDHMVDLESKAQISTDETSQIIQNKRIYAMMLQQAENYNDTGELMSLRDINRFQFRKNRSNEDVPTTKAGSGEEVQ